MAAKPEILERELEIVPEDIQALTVIPPPAQMAVSRPPDVVLEEARLAAKALTNVIESKPKKVVFNGNTYLEFEDWQTLAKFYGATVKVTETKYVEFGEVKGFEAKAVVINVATGMEISGAEAMCLNDEPNWKKKPLFQLKSMAQTRASAKALRNVFAWVVVLAGYKPTPAEEMDGVRPNKAQAGASSPHEPEQEEKASDTLEGFITGVEEAKGVTWISVIDAKDETWACVARRESVLEVLRNAAKGDRVELLVNICAKPGKKTFCDIMGVMALDKEEEAVAE